MLKWTASSQRLHELASAPAQSTLRVARRARRERRATIANKENVPSVGYTSTPMPLARLRNSPLVLAPLSDIRNVTPEAVRSPLQPLQRVAVQSVRYATTLPRYEEEYSPSAGTLPSGQHLALRGLLPLDPFLEQPRYIGVAQQLKKRKLEADFVATLEEETVTAPAAAAAAVPTAAKSVQQKPLRPVTPQPSTDMGDQTLDRLIDAILDSACKADASSRKKPRKSFNLRRRTLVKQQLESQCVAMLSPSYAAGDDPASDLSFAMLPALTPEPPSPLAPLPQSVLRQLPTPQLGAVPRRHSDQQAGLSDTFCLATPVRPLKRSRQCPEQPKQEVDCAAESPLKRYKVDARNYFEVGLALPSIYV